MKVFHLVVLSAVPMVVLRAETLVALKVVQLVVVKVVQLVEVHRQQDDGLLDLLSDIREGKQDLYARHGPTISSISAPLPV